MTAADRAVWLARVESLQRFVTRGNVLIVALAVVVLGSYCAGKSRGAQQQKDAVFEKAHAALIDTIKVTETKLVHDTVTVRVTKGSADTARATFVASEAIVEAAAAKSDSVASTLVLPALHACDAAIQADTIAYRAVVVALTDMTSDRDLWKARAELDEAHTDRPSRFGFKGGLALGASAIALLLHFVR